MTTFLIALVVYYSLQLHFLSIPPISLLLQGTNFSAVHINVVAMECDLHDVKKNARKTDILEAHDFRCKLIERNCMCVHNRFIPSLAKTKSELRMFDGVTWSKSYVNADLSLKL